MIFGGINNPMNDDGKIDGENKSDNSSELDIEEDFDV